MQSLLLFVKRCKTFLSFNLFDKFLIIKVFFLTGLIRLIILSIPFKRIKKYMGELNRESSKEVNKEQYDISNRISWAVNTVSRHTPWESKCLVKALTAQYLLSRKGIITTLYLGVGKDKNIIKDEKFNKNEESKIIAHSWIRYGNSYVTGGNGEGYAIVAKFMKGGVKNND